MKIEDAADGRSTITRKNLLTQRAWAWEADSSKRKKLIRDEIKEIDADR
jgi:hypothetical protein